MSLSEKDLNSPTESDTTLNLAPAAKSRKPTPVMI